MLTKRKVILAKIESSYGVDPSPVAGTDAVLVEDPKWALAGARMNDRNAVSDSLATFKKVFGGTLLQMQCNVELKGSGAAGTAPEIGPILRACGLAETIAPATSVAYAPASSGHESVTVYIYEDGTLYKILGARGNVEFNLEAGKQGMATVTLTGHLSANPTDAALASPTYSSEVPPPVIGATFAIGGYSAVAAKVAFSLNNTVATPADISASDGYDDIVLTARDVAGSFDPSAVVVATNDYFADFRAGSDLALATGTIGGTAGNQYAVSMPAVYYREIGPGDRDGLLTYEIGFGAAESSGDDEVTITFT